MTVFMVMDLKSTGEEGCCTALAAHSSCALKQNGIVGGAFTAGVVWSRSVLSPQASCPKLLPFERNRLNPPATDYFNKGNATQKKVGELTRSMMTKHVMERRPPTPPTPPIHHSSTPLIPLPTHYQIIAGLGIV